MTLLSQLPMEKMLELGVNPDEGCPCKDNSGYINDHE